MESANQFSETKKLSRTGIVNIMEHTNGGIFTVNFNKQITKEYGERQLSEMDPDELKTDEGRSRIMNALLKGESRTLRGKIQNTEPKMGRSQVIDLDVNERRLVDHRTINWLIYKNVKFIVQ